MPSNISTSVKGRHVPVYIIAHATGIVVDNHHVLQSKESLKTDVSNRNILLIFLTETQ